MVSRLIEEQEQLSGRFNKLEAFIDDVTNSSKMEVDDWNLLIIQLSAMDTYLTTLTTRMDRLGIEYTE